MLCRSVVLVQKNGTLLQQTPVLDDDPDPDPW